MKGAHLKAGERKSGRARRAQPKKNKKNSLGKKQRRAIHIYPASEVHFTRRNG